MSSGVGLELATELFIRAPDAAAEVFVIDGRFRVTRDVRSGAAGRGVGELRVWLAPGLYKVKCRVGGTIYEKHIALEKGQDRLEVQIHASDVPFAAAAP